MSESYRIRGRVARTHANRNINRTALIASAILETSMYNLKTLMAYCIRKRIAVNVDISTILPYSARKKNTQIVPECSFINPATSSDSASGRSNGVRLEKASA